MRFIFDALASLWMALAWPGPKPPPTAPLETETQTFVIASASKHLGWVEFRLEKTSSDAGGSNFSNVIDSLDTLTAIRHWAIHPQVEGDTLRIDLHEGHDSRLQVSDAPRDKGFSYTINDLPYLYLDMPQGAPVPFGIAATPTDTASFHWLRVNTDGMDGGVLVHRL